MIISKKKRELKKKLNSTIEIFFMILSFLRFFSTFLNPANELKKIFSQANEFWSDLTDGCTDVNLFFSSHQIIMLFIVRLL